jgi:endonuclease/exonuclease/phosphatase family metal-dependent hydrolase
VRFVAYNVENWLTMERTVNGAGAPGREKPDKERRAVVAMIVAAQPDVLGVCEMGGETEVAELGKRLANAGLPLPYHIVVGGADPTRHLALLSKYPIQTPTAHDHLSYSSFGKSYSMQRGILDAVVETPAGPVQFVGVHLKSKRDVDGEDQEDMRRNEAHLLRRELDALLESDPGAKLVVYGDMNDTRQSPAIRTVQGPEKGPKSLTIAPLKDSRGESWTQHWSYQEVYSRIDYVMLSSSLKSSLVNEESRVMDEAAWSDASDHRPLLIVLKHLN